MFKVPGSSSEVLAEHHFTEDLQRFLASVGQRPPGGTQLNGRPVKLLHLFQTVTSRGGWQKVCQQSAWEDVAYATGIAEPCVNAGHAVKAIYYQYLLKFECAKFNRTLTEDFNDDEDIFKRFNNGPGYSRIPGYLRASCGLMEEMKEEDPLERLHLALSSGLPNEVDFSVNALLIRSADANHPLLLGDGHVALIEALVANVAVFANHPGSLVGVYNTFRRETNKDYVRYWKETVDDERILEMIAEDDYRGEQPSTDDTAASDLFAELPSLDSNEIRITLIGTIIQNLSIEERNASFFAKHTACLKFLFLCANSTRSQVAELGLDMAISIAPQIAVSTAEPWIMSLLTTTVQKCITSPDRMRLLQGLILLAKICDVETNREVVTESLEDCHYTLLSHNLCVPDIPVVIFSLEVLYKLSGLGEQQATRIAQNANNIEFLVQLVTLTAELLETHAQFIDLDASEHISSNRPIAIPQRGQLQQIQQQQQFPGGNNPIISSDEVDVTVNWLRRVYEADDNFAMAMSDVHKDYVMFCLSEGKLSPLLTSFTHCFKLAFPQGRTMNLAIEGKSQLCILGMKRRANLTIEGSKQNGPSQNFHQPNQSTTCGGTSSQLLLQKMISSPSTSSDPSSAPPPMHNQNPLTKYSSMSSPASVDLKQNFRNCQESSLIRSLLATKINRKHSSSPADGSPAPHFPPEDWKTQDDSNLRSDGGSHFSDNIFSDIDSNDSFGGLGKKAPRSRSVSVVGDSIVAPVKKKRTKKIKTDAGNFIVPQTTPKLVNGNSHLFSDDSHSNTSTPMAVPYVLDETPKNVKRGRGRPPRNGLIIPPNPIVNGHGSGEVPVKTSEKGSPGKPRRSGRKPKPKKFVDLSEAEVNGMPNGHTATEPEAEAKVMMPMEKKPRAKSVRKKQPTKAQAKKAAAEAGILGNGQAGVMDDGILDYICEWEGCNRSFMDPSTVFKHNYDSHVSTAVEGVCRWPNCTGIKRQALSLITHLHETHCSHGEQLRQAMRRRDLRKNICSTISPTAPVPAPTAYTEYTALHSIQARYGSAVASDFTPQSESGNTKTVRLTAALVLRNIAHYSHVGRIKMQRFESYLTTSAMQLSEASQVIGECLFYLSVHRRDHEQ